MTVEEAKALIESAKSTERECERMRDEIEAKREELLSAKSALRGGTPVLTSESLSMPERVYFALEKLYVQYSEQMQRVFERRNELNKAIAQLDPLEQEIVRAWIGGRTEEQIGKKVGYSRPTIARRKRRILIKLAKL